MEIHHAPIPDTRHFGFTWEFYITPGAGETEWRAPSVGGEFVVMHFEDEGPEFLLFEFGGQGDNIWEHTFGIYDSPLEAMHAARKIQTSRNLLWDVMDKEMRGHDTAD